MCQDFSRTVQGEAIKSSFMPNSDKVSEKASPKEVPVRYFPHLWLSNRANMRVIMNMFMNGNQELTDGQLKTH
jgi:hypothetical protein